MKSSFGSHPDKRKILIWSVIALVFIAAAFYGAYRLGRFLELRKEEPRGSIDPSIFGNVIEYNGETYRLKKRLTSILLIGVDKESTEESVGFRNGGQADLLLLLVVDDNAKTVSTIQIDRDTMAEITVLGVLGNPAGTTKAQISLSHGFGDGKVQSSLFAVEAVERLLLGTQIDHYVTMNLDAISVLNDAVGGVTVTLEDDFTTIDPVMAKGTTLTLQGEQAEYYVRGRMTIGDGTNEARMKRQGAFLEALIAKITSSDDAEFIGKVYDVLEPYLLTNMNRGCIMNLVWNAKNYAREAILHPRGVYRVSDGFMEFHIDETELEALVMETFYEPAE